MRPSSPALTLYSRAALSVVLAIFALLSISTAALAQRAKQRRQKGGEVPVQNIESTDVGAMLQQAANTRIDVTSDEMAKILADRYWSGSTRAKDIKDAMKHCNNPGYVWRDGGVPYEDTTNACTGLAAMLARDAGLASPDTEIAFLRACAFPHFPGINPSSALYNPCAELGDFYRARACVASQFSDLSIPSYASYCQLVRLGDFNSVRSKNLALALAVYQKAPNCHATNFTPQHAQYFETACPIGAADVLLADGQQAQGQAAMRSICGQFSISGGAPGDCLGFLPHVAQQTDTGTSNDQSAPADQQANEAAQKQQDIQDKIDSLNNEIQQLENDASDADQNADNLATNSNCTGGFGAYAQIAQQGCENINSIGVAKFRSEAAKDRNQADDDRAEIERLQGEEVQEAPHRDASFGGALAQQMQQNPQPSIVDTANQQAANMIAVGAANDAARAQAAEQAAERRQEQEAAQQREQEAQEQAQQAAAQARAQAAAQAAQQAQQQAANNSSSGNGNSTVAATCTNESNFVTATSKLNPDGIAVGFLTNNSNQPLYVTYTFARGGQPAKNQTGSLTVNPGQTIGGEGGGVWAATSGASAVDSNPVRLYWFAVPQSESNRSCGSPW